MELASEQAWRTMHTLHSLVALASTHLVVVSVASAMREFDSVVRRLGQQSIASAEQQLWFEICLLTLEILPDRSRQCVLSSASV